MKIFASVCPLLTLFSVAAFVPLKAAAAVPTVSITAQSPSITAGQSDTLTVTETSAASIQVTGSNGTSYNLPYSGGSITVAPSSTTTYTATATNSHGSATSQTTVTVGSGTTTPTVSIAAASSTISAGSSDTLKIAATNASNVSVSGSDGSSYSVPASGGSISITPKATTTYTATATGSTGATATAKTTVTVSTSTTGAPTVNITASSTSISSGQSDTLTVTETKAGSIQVTGSNGTSYNLPYSGGSLSVSPTSTTTYTATATNSHGSTTAQVTVNVGATNTNPTVTISAQNSSISQGSSDTLTVKATNATTVNVTGSDGSSYSLSSSGGSVTVTPSSTTTYTAEASNASGTTASAQTTVTVGSSSGAGLDSIQHVIFMLQENHSFDNYFGMLNPYRHANGWDVGADGKTYDVDGIDDKLNTITNDDDQGDVYHLYKLRSTCIDDDSSAWLASYGDVSRWEFTPTRPIRMDGFVHTAEGFANSCGSQCGGAMTDMTGERAMGYYDQDFLNYYYYMASQFAVSDRWFSPISSESVPNRIATFSGGTTQGLVYPPGEDKLPQLSINNIFEELQKAGVSWKVYYTTVQGACFAGTTCGSGSSNLPVTTFLSFSYSFNFVRMMPSSGTCPSPMKPSSAVGDTTNSFCIDTNHVAPLSQYYTDVQNNTLPAFAFIESGSGRNDEHPGSQQSVLIGQAEVAKIVNALMASPSWSSSVFFFSYDEGGGPYDHVPPVPGHSNDFTDASLGSIPDISSIAVNPDGYGPCVGSGGTPTLHCDLKTSENDPGTKSTDAPAQQGFKAQLGFRVPNFVVSPFTRKHYVSHVPMDHTAIIKFVENRFIGSSAHLTARDAAQPNLLDFFDFTNKPWSTPPTPPTPASASSLGYNPCLPQSMGP